ncbi:gamma-butyrobetaine dioxygenase-like [Apostichopus japonicus]|uniref:gamma-butyrobetaine dioxygenase-like n=1 Tax=Stichopus japonicus TaxID=307972 RepID=UPI003AB16490
MFISTQVARATLRVLLRQSANTCSQRFASTSKNSLPVVSAGSGETSHLLQTCAKKKSDPLEYENLLQASLGSQVKNSQIVKKLICQDGMVDVTWKDDGTSRYHSKWLWFNCFCSECMQPNSGQKIVKPGDIPWKLTAVNAKEFENDDGAFIEVQFKEVNHIVRLPQEWLKLYSYSTDSLQAKSEMRDPPYFTQGPIKAFDYQAVSDTESSHYFEWLHNLNLSGVTIVNNVPTETGASGKVGELIGPVTTTLYGKVSDVVAVENPINVAYSSISLDVHQDLMYYESPPGLQLLHCLRFCPQVTGGESLFIDAFYAAENFRQEHPHHFQTLLKVPATFKKIHFDRDNPAAYLYQRPHITVNSHQKITNVIWSPPFEGPLQVSEELVEPYFEAYQAFAETIHKAPVVTHRMVPGDCLVFNNRRMLHGRNSYELNGGARHFQVCYVNTDDFIQRVQVEHIRRKTGQFAKRVGNQCNF